MLSASQGWPDISWDGSKQQSSIQKTDTDCCHILTHHRGPPGAGSLQNCIEPANIAATTTLLAEGGCLGHMQHPESSKCLTFPWTTLRSPSCWEQRIQVVEVLRPPKGRVST